MHVATGFAGRFVPGNARTICKPAVMTSDSETGRGDPAPPTAQVLGSAEREANAMLLPAIDDLDLRSQLAALIEQPPVVGMPGESVTVYAQAAECKVTVHDAVVVTVNGVALTEAESEAIHRVVSWAIELTARAEQLTDASQVLVAFMRWAIQRFPPETWDHVSSIRL